MNEIAAALSFVAIAAVRSCLAQLFSAFVEFVGPPIRLAFYFVSNCRRTDDQFHGFALLLANVD